MQFCDKIVISTWHVYRGERSEAEGLISSLTSTAIDIFLITARPRPGSGRPPPGPLAPPYPGLNRRPSPRIKTDKNPKPIRRPHAPPPGW